MGRFLVTSDELDTREWAAEDDDVPGVGNWVVCPYVVDGEDALMGYVEDDWDCDAKEFEGESDSFEERHFVELSRLYMYGCQF